MKVAFLDSGTGQEELARLICEHDTISIAVAWASTHDTFNLLFTKKHSAKLKHLIIGVNGFGTEPAALDLAAKIPCAKVTEGKGTSLFHPKIYLFSSGDRAEAIIGSANFTNGGMGRNTEASVLISGTVSDDIFVKLHKQVREYAKTARKLTPTLAEEYRAKHKRDAKSRRVRNPELGEPPREWQGLQSRIARWTWAEYLDQINEHAQVSIDGNFARLKNGLAVLDFARRRFARMGSFSDLPGMDRKAIAGLVERMEVDVERERVESIGFGQFGSMRGAGVFNKIVTSDTLVNRIALALDDIPFHGLVTRQHYETYAERFVAAFAEEKRGGGLPTASRLLAMKRPDVFICVDGANKTRLATHLNTTPSGLDLDTYWKRVIDPILSSPWYGQKKPSGKRNGQIWEGRVALLDIVYYDAL